MTNVSEPRSILYSIMGGGTSKNQDPADEGPPEIPTFQQFIKDTIEDRIIENAVQPMTTQGWKTQRYHKKLVIAQSKQHSDDQEHDFFYHVTRGNFERVRLITKTLKEGNIPCEKGTAKRCNCVKCKVDQRDAVGGSVIHIAYLYKEWKIARFLVTEFPDIASKSYDNGQWVDDHVE